MSSGSGGCAKIMCSFGLVNFAPDRVLASAAE